MRSMSKLMCVVAATAMMFSTSTLATAGWGPCDYPLKPAPCNADVSGQGGGYLMALLTLTTCFMSLKIGMKWATGPAVRMATSLRWTPVTASSTSVTF